MVYNYLDKINYPKDLKKFKIEDLKKIAKELRQKTIESVSNAISIINHYICFTIFSK